MALVLKNLTESRLKEYHSLHYLNNVLTSFDIGKRKNEPNTPEILKFHNDSVHLSNGNNVLSTFFKKSKSK